MLLDAAARRIKKTVAAECETWGGVMLEGDVRLVLICWLSYASPFSELSHNSLTK